AGETHGLGGVLLRSVFLGGRVLLGLGLGVFLLLAFPTEEAHRLRPPAQQDTEFGGIHQTPLQPNDESGTRSAAPRDPTRGAPRSRARNKTRPRRRGTPRS